MAFGFKNNFFSGPRSGYSPNIEVGWGAPGEVGGEGTYEAVTSYNEVAALLSSSSKRLQHHLETKSRGKIDRERLVSTDPRAVLPSDHGDGTLFLGERWMRKLGDQSKGPPQLAGRFYDSDVALSYLITSSVRITSQF